MRRLVQILAWLPRPRLPILAHSHRGFFQVAVAEFLTHTGIGLDNLLRSTSYQGQTWAPMTKVAPIQWWGAAHLTLAAALLLSSYYTDQLTWLFRTAFLLSMTMYLSNLGLILQGTLKPRPAVVVLAHPHVGGPLYLPIIIGFPLLTSIAGFFEPMVNPASIAKK